MLQAAELEPIKAAVVTSALDAIVMIDESGCVLALNPAAEATFGYSREEALGRPIADLIVPGHLREAHRRGLAAYLAGGPAKVLGQRVETEAVCKDGRIIPIELVVLELEVAGRRLFSATIRDRSGDAAQEEELDLVRRQLELAVEGAQIGVWSYNPRTGSCWFSDRSKALWGLKENYIANARDLEKVIHPADRGRTAGPFYDRLPEQPLSVEYRIIRPDGEIRWIYALGAAVADEDGVPEAVHGIHLDITDRKRAEEELEQMRRHLELAVEGAQLGVWSYNPSTGASWFSDRAKEMLGLSENFITEAGEFRKRVHPDDRQKLVFAREEGIPEGPVAAEYRVILPSGETRWVFSLGAAVRDENDVTQSIYGILDDITDRRKERQELESTRRQLEMALEGAKLGVWSFEPAAQSCWFSERAAQLLGLEGLEDGLMANAWDLQKVIHPDDWDHFKAPYVGRFPDGHLETEYRVIRPDGEVRWLYAMGTAVRDEKGRPQTIFGVNFDITERKRAEEELDSIRQRLDIAVEGAKLGVWTLDPRTGASWFSDRARDLIGLPGNRVATPQAYLEHVHPDDWEKLSTVWASGFPSESVGVEYRIIRPDGEVRWVYGLGAADRDESGEVDAIHGILIDITDRKQANEALELTRRQLELAMQGAQLGVWSFDPATGSCWFSDQSKAMLGLPDNRLEHGGELEKHIHPDDWDLVSWPYYNRYPDEPLGIEFRVPQPDGSNRWVYALGNAVRDAAGDIETIHGIHIDITSRKQSDEQLEVMQRRLELAMSGAKIGVWSYNPASGTIWYSDRSREIYALEPGDSLDSTTLRARVHPDDWERLSAPYYEGFPEEALEIEYRIIRPDGEVRWVYALGAAATKDEHGVVQAVHGIHIDITDRKRAEEELGRSRDALLQSEKLAALGALLAGVSHELNNPLAAIVGQAEMLAEDSQGTVFEERAKRIGAAAERSARIVQTFLAMARQRERQTAMVSLNDVIGSALDLTDYALRTAGVAVRVNFGSALPPVEGDRDQLHQVLVNLIVNAQQAMEKGEAFEKVLTIRTSVNQAGRVLVDVTDTGPGVPEAVRHRIFEPFFTTKRQGRGGGTGIGLSFSQGIITAHGGSLTVEPSRRGAHFRIELPAAPGETLTVVPREEVILPDVMPSQRRCLVVEDEPDVAATLSDLIQREGFEVVVASNGTEAFYALDKGDFDLLFSDLRMPLLNGPELYERLCEIRPELVKRMCFVTGDTMGDAMGEFLRTCGRPILEKPFTKAGIRAVLAALVDPS
jgi:PAS domain S-box-containing protein